MTLFVLAAVDVAAFLAWTGMFLPREAPRGDAYAARFARACAFVSAPFAQLPSMPARAASAAMLLLLAALRTVVIARAGAVEAVFAAPFAARAPAVDPGSRDAAAFAAPFAFSIVSMACSLLKVWTAWTVARMFGAKPGPDMPGYGICSLAAAPVSRLPAWALAAAVPALHCCAAAAVLSVSPGVRADPAVMDAIRSALAGMPSPLPLPSDSPAAFAPGGGAAAAAAGCAILGAALFAEGLGFAARAIFTLFVLKILAALFRNAGMAAFCGAVIATMRGALHGRGAAKGGRDWSPLAAWFICFAASGIAANLALFAAGAMEAAE